MNWVTKRALWSFRGPPDSTPPDSPYRKRRMAEPFPPICATGSHEYYFDLFWLNPEAN